jgi:hypothetical protein
MIIAFPPCTHLAVSGARHFEKKRKDGRQREAIEFFCSFFNAEYRSDGTEERSQCAVITFTVKYNIPFLNTTEKDFII